jgi:L-ribulose-5-phosphate 3-epimerase
MLLGYNTNGFSSHSLEDAIEVVAGIGYRSLGLTLDHHALNPHGGDLAAQVERCRTRLRAHGLVPVIETGARFLLDPWRKHWPTLLDEDQGARGRRLDFLKRAVDLAPQIGAGVVSVWSGAAPVGSGPDVLDPRLIEGLRALCSYAGERGIVIGFEPEPGMYVETMAEYERVAAAVDHRSFGLTLDIGHAHITEPGGAEETVRRFASQIVNVHLEGMWRTAHDHLPPWEGDLDVRRVWHVLGAVGYQGPATFELSRHSHAAVETARRAFAFLGGTIAPQNQAG